MDDGFYTRGGGTIRIYSPLNAQHPLVGRPCARCGRVFEHLDRTALAPIETPVEAGSLTVEAVPVHADCLNDEEKGKTTE